MSQHISNLVWKLRRKHGITPAQKLVLLKLSDCCWDDGSNAFPKVDTIAAETCLARRTVQSNLKILLDTDMLAIQEEATHNFPTKYWINATKLKALIKGTEVLEMHPRDAGAAPLGVQETANRGAGAAPKSLINQNIEPVEEPIPPTAVSRVEDNPYLSPDTPELTYDSSDPTEDEHTSTDKHAKWRYPKSEICRKIFNDRKKKYFRSMEEKSAWTKVETLLSTKQITEEWIWHQHKMAAVPGESRYRWNWVTFCRYTTNLEKFREWDIRHHTRDTRDDATVDSTDMDEILKHFGGSIKRDG